MQEEEHGQADGRCVRGGLYLLDVLLRAHTCDGHLLSALMPESLYVCVHGVGHTRQNATPLHQGGSM